MSYSHKYSPANPLIPSLDMNAVSAPPSLLSQPIPVDTNGDLKIDLFGAIPSTSSSGPFKIWSNVWNSSDPQSEIFEMYVVYAHVLCGRIEDSPLPRIEPKLEGPQCKLSNPHSNAAVDLDGDCLAGKYIFKPTTRTVCDLSFARPLPCLR